MVFVLLVLIALLFVLERFSQANPVRVMLGAGATPAQVAREQQALGYNRPIPVQYASYVWDIMHGNLQMSLRTRDSVASDLATFLPATIELAVAGMFVAFVVALTIGLAGAMRVRGERALRFTMVVGASTPSFLLAIVGLFVFCPRVGRCRT
jgi:peptide/nickel transport system permease protein